MKVFNTSFTLQTEGRTEVSDITKLVRDALLRSSVTAGIALVNTLHTTCALFVNEYQSALMDDVMALAERLVPERGGFRHDDSRYSGCERGNAHAHLRTALFGLTEDRPALLEERMARTARALQATALNAAARLERQADRARRPGRLDYPTEIKRWRAFAAQAEQMAERWEQRP